MGNAGGTGWVLIVAMRLAEAEAVVFLAKLLLVSFFRKKGY